MALGTMALIGGGAQVIGGLFGVSSAKKRAEAAAKDKRRLPRKLTH